MHIQKFDVQKAHMDTLLAQWRCRKYVKMQKRLTLNIITPNRWMKNLNYPMFYSS